MPLTDDSCFNSVCSLSFRAESEHIKEVVKPYDWTYTTDYKGTVFGGKEEAKLKVMLVNFREIHEIVIS